MNLARLSVVALCLTSLCAAQQSGHDDDAVGIVLALELAWNQAEQRKDGKALDAILDDSLLYIDYDGSLHSKAEFLATVKSGIRQPTTETTQNMTGHMFRDTIVVTGIYTVKGIEQGKAYVRRGRFTDTWVLRDGKWLCIAAQATPIVR